MNFGYGRDGELEEENDALEDDAVFSFEVGLENRMSTLFSLRAEIAIQEDDMEGAYGRLLSFQTGYYRMLTKSDLEDIRVTGLLPPMCVIVKLNREKLRRRRAARGYR